MFSGGIEKQHWVVMGYVFKGCEMGTLKWVKSKGLSHINQVSHFYTP